jgi:predicted transcriptional regulator
MKFMQPQEMEVWYILPAIRKELCLALKRKGLSQKEAAAKLGLTEAAISQYIKGKRGAIDVSEFSKEFDKAAGRMLKGSHVVEEVQKILDLIKVSGFFCKLHCELDSSLPKSCNFCGL